MTTDWRAKLLALRAELEEARARYRAAQKLKGKR